MEDLEIFQELGMTKNEGKVYSELVKHGKLSAADISSKSGVPYGKIYVVLQSLLDKGFAQTIPDKVKKFVASDPKSLIKMIDDKEKDLEKVKSKINELKQSYDQKDKDFLLIGEGDKGFWKIEEKISMFKDHSYRVRVNSITTPQRLTWMKKMMKKGADIRELVILDKGTKKNVKKLLKFNPNVREFANKGVALAFTENEVFMGLINKNTTLLIRDEALADCLSRMYLAAFDKAKFIR